LGDPGTPGKKGTRILPLYAGGCNICVTSQKAAQRVTGSAGLYLENKPRLKAAPEPVRRLKDHEKELLRRGRGRATPRVIADPEPVIAGWTQYYRLA